MFGLLDFYVYLMSCLIFFRLFLVLCYLWVLLFVGKFNNVVDEDKNEEFGIYDVGDLVVNECFKKK